LLISVTTCSKQALIAGDPFAGGLYVAGGGDEVLKFMCDAVSAFPIETGSYGRKLVTG
jgi:hypothetical protein